LQNIDPDGLLAFDPITGASLNELYKKVYVHYLGNNGNPSCNAFTKFYTKSPGNDILFLHQYRIKAVENRYTIS
jgi:hypothetical protein